MKTEIIPIQTILMPKYYQDFQCLAAACQNDCCHGWCIDFNKKDYLSMRRENAPAEVKQRLDKTVRRYRAKDDNPNNYYAYFQLDEKQCCPMQDPDGLCSLQKACGHQALPVVCQDYPRRKCLTPAAREFSLSPSCEGVLQLLWNLPDGVDFVEEPLSQREQKFVESSEYGLLFPVVRSMCVDILQCRSFSLPQRLILMGMSLQKLQNADLTRPDLPDWVSHTTALLNDPATLTELSVLPQNHRIPLSQNIFCTIELLTSGESQFQYLLDNLNVSFERSGNTEKISVHYDSERYKEYCVSLEDLLSDHTYFFENLMVAAAMYLSFPDMHDFETLWKSYVSFCNLYSFFHFAAAGCGNSPSRERLFCALVMASRSLLHSTTRQIVIRDDFFRNESATLAHMAMLVNG